MLIARKNFGRSGFQIPPAIFGTSALGNLYTAPEDDVKLSIVRECFHHVATPLVFDCAGKYGAGLALEMLGKTLEQLSIHPEDVIISNKLGWFRTPLKTPEPTFEKGIWKDIHNDAVQLISYDGIMKCWEQGNELLGGKYKPGLVSVHDPDEFLSGIADESEKKKRYKAIMEAYRALLYLKSIGEVKAIGVGAKEWKIVERISRDVDLDWVMFANSMTIFSHPPELCSCMEMLHKRGVGIINSGVFNAGFLTGGRFFNYRAIEPDTTENKRIFKWREDFMNICRKHEVEPAAACVHFAMTPPGVSAVSLNTSDPSRIKRNAELVTTEVPHDFYREMREKGLIKKNYPYLGI